MLWEMPATQQTRGLRRRQAAHPATRGRERALARVRLPESAQAAADRWKTTEQVQFPLICSFKSKTTKSCRPYDFQKNSRPNRSNVNSVGRGRKIRRDLRRFPCEVDDDARRYGRACWKLSRAIATVRAETRIQSSPKERPHGSHRQGGGGGRWGGRSWVSRRQCVTLNGYSTCDRVVSILVV